MRRGVVSGGPGGYGGGVSGGTGAGAGAGFASSALKDRSPTTFRHNERVALALLPALAVVAGSAETTVLWVLLAGAAITYMLDASGARQATLLSAWATLAATNVGLLLTGAPTERGARPPSLSLLAAGFNASTLLAVGCWATLQFRWVHRKHTAAVLSLEKGLLSACLPLGAAAAGLVCLTALTPAASPFGTCAALLALYFALCPPLESSFAPSRAVSRSSAARGALLFALLPPLQYASMHRRLLWAHREVHSWALLSLVSFPVAAMSSARDGLWWLERREGKGGSRNGGGRSHRRLRRALLLLSCAGAVAGLVGRVLLRSAGQYLALPRPWAGIALWVALVPVAAFGAMHASGLLQEEDGDGGAVGGGDVFSSGRRPPKTAAVAGPTLVLAACALSVAAGVPFWALPAPLRAAAGLTLSWSGGSGSGGRGRTKNDGGIDLLHSLLFAAGALATGSWFAWHHYGHLSLADAGDDGSFPSASLASLAFASVAVAAPAAVLPGLASKAAAAASASPTSSSPSASRAVGGAAARLGAGLALLLHACGLAALEQALYCGTGEPPSTAPAAPWASPAAEAYPAYLVVATSVALSAAARSLRRAGGGALAGATTWLCVAKLSVLLLPASRPLWPSAMWAASAGPGISAALSPPPSPPRGDDDDEVSPDRRPPPPRLSKAAAFSLATLGALATYSARFLVFELLELAQGGARPTHAAAAGALAVALALATAPALHAARVAGPALALPVAVGAAGVAALALEPPLPASALGGNCSWGSLCPAALLRWDEAHAPGSSPPSSPADDVAVWGDLGLSGRAPGAGAPAWLLVAASAAGAASAAVGGFGREGKRGRRGKRGVFSSLARFFGGASSVSLAATSAAAVGAFVAGEAFPSPPGEDGSDDGGLASFLLSLSGASAARALLSSRAALHLSVLSSAVALSLCALLARSRSRTAGHALRLASLLWLSTLASAALALRRSFSSSSSPAAVIRRMRQQPLRLFPDAANAATRDADASESSTLAALAAAESLLFALACKLRVSLEARRDRDRIAVEGRGGGGGGERTSASAGAAAAAACHRGANMRFLPLLSNLLTVGGFALAVLAGALAEAASSPFSTTGGEGAAGKALSELSAAARSAAALSPALLLLCADPLLFRGLSPEAGSSRRYAPPALAAALSLASATLLSLARDAAVRRTVVAGFSEAAFAAAASGGGGGEKRGLFPSTSSAAPGVLGDSLRETGMVLLALPAHLLLLAHLWTRGGGGSDKSPRPSSVPFVAAVAAMPPSALALAAARCSSTKWLALGSVAAAATVAGQQGLAGGRARRFS